MSITRNSNQLLILWKDFVEFWYTIPLFLRIVLWLIFLVAGVNIVLSLVKSIIHYKTTWKQKPDTQLMYSFTMGSGFYQGKLIYLEAHKYLFDHKWSKFSLAGMAFRLGNLTHDSKGVLFAYTLAYIPLAILGSVEMLFRIIIGATLYNIISIAYFSLLIAGWSLDLLLIPLFNLADRTTWVTQHCPKDYATFKLPVFECPHCGTQHNKLYPGDTGLLWAKCICGRFIPCASLSKRKQLKSFCPKCHYALAGASIRSLTIQIVGGNSSGKSAFISAFQHEYIAKAQNTGNRNLSTSPEEDFLALENMFHSGSTTKSPHNEVCAYYILHGNKGSSDDGIVIYDVPDELILSDQYERNPLNFAYCDGLVIIIDPLSIQSVRKECEKTTGTTSTFGYSDDSAEDLIIHFINKYSEVAGRLARKMSDIPVAVAITKTDLTTIRQKIGYVKIKAEYAANHNLYYSLSDARNKICRKYLSDIGLSNAINNLDSVFSNIAYFPISAIGHIPDGTQFEPQNILEPIGWLAHQCQSSIYDPAIFGEEDK